MNKIYRLTLIRAAIPAVLSACAAITVLSGCTVNNNTASSTLPTISIIETSIEDTLNSKETTLKEDEPAGETNKNIILDTDALLDSLESFDDGDFILLEDYIPGIVIDLKYATCDNFTGERIYDFSDAYLRCGTVKKLIKVQSELNSYGYGLKVWDAYRPYEAQVKLWEVYPNGTYVANPAAGIAGHNTGRTLDITLVDLEGNEIAMPTTFDTFSSLADRDYSDCSKEAATNATLLEDVMTKYGFTGYSGEWWDFTDNDKYGGDNNFVPPYDESLTGVIPYDFVSDLSVSSETGQLIIVEINEGSSSGTLSMHTKDANGVWMQLFSTEASVARDGIGQAHEGEMITPKGMYSFTHAFGIKSNPGTRYSYTQVDDSYYWVDDSNSVYYNKFVTTNDTPVSWSSAEHITDNAPMYNYVLALDYNSDCVPMEGSAIFLHVKSGAYTAGCIAIDEDMMIKVLNNVHTDCRIIIGTPDEIKNY